MVLSTFHPLSTPSDTQMICISSERYLLRSIICVVSKVPWHYLYLLHLNLLHAVSVYILFISLCLLMWLLSSHLHFFSSLQDVSELRNELQRKELLVQKHLSKLHHWQQVLEDVSVQHRKPSDLPPPGPLAFLEQASASLPPAPLKPN